MNVKTKSDRFCCNTYRGCSIAAKAVTPICTELCGMQYGWQSYDTRQQSHAVRSPCCTVQSYLSASTALHAATEENVKSKHSR